MYSYGPPHMAVQKQDDQHEHTFSNYVRIQDVVQKTCLRRWTIGKSGERGSGISVLPARHDDDDDDLYKKLLLLSVNANKTELMRFKHKDRYGLILWHINHCWLCDAKSSLYIYIKYIGFGFGWVLWLINYCRLFNVKSSL